VLQDTTVIFEYLERRFPEPSAYPPGPRQRLAAYLVDLFASENLKVAWHYRWNYPEPNRHFVLREFGRSFKPRGTDELLDHYGGVVARQMDGHRSRIGITPEMFPMMEQIYFNLLDGLEAHFTDHPYLFGGLPSIADFSLMGPLFAHLGRDPWPLHLMQQRAPRVFRWVEHMNTPEIQSPEFWDVPVAYLPDDEVPQTVVQLLQTFCADYAPIYSASAALYDQWLADHPDAEKGTTLSQTDEDQPSLGQITVPLREHQMTMGAPGHSLWLLQRTLDWLAQLSPEDRAACQSFAKDCGAETLLSTPISRPLTRVGNRLAVA